MIEQAAAIQRVRLPVRDLRFGGERGCLARAGLRGAQVAGLGGEADGVGKQVLDLLDLFCIAVERVRQRGQRLRRCAVMLTVQAAGEGQGADEPVPDPLGVRGGSGEAAARRGDVAAMEADHGGDAEIAAGCGGFLQVLRQDPTSASASSHRPVSKSS